MAYITVYEVLQGIFILGFLFVFLLPNDVSACACVRTFFALW